ncbi:MAG: 5'-nucleotidase C-terminal domain-containing protein [Anaerolineaceae bacterium]|nr:5'-nucleotidase C-terminal domain-containing protein [Anaerolineaceae bacterium]
MQRNVALLFAIALCVMLVAPLSAQDESFELTIMHTNDVHAEHEPDRDGNGGAARQATVVRQIRDEVANSLLLDGGDRFTGTLFHIQWMGQDSAQIMNMIGYDAMTLGNHEFDNGDDVLAAFIDALEFPVVTANVDFSESPHLAGKIEPMVTLDVAGESIGIIGLVTPDSEILASPGPELVFEHDLATVAQNAVDDLTAAGVNKIILLTHIGYEADIEVAQQVSGVDVVVGGHTNTFLSNRYTGAIGEYPTVLESASGEPVLVVQASARTHYLGRLDLEFDGAGVLSDWEGDAILLSRYIAAAPDVADLVAGLAEPIAALRQQVVAEAAVKLDGARSICRVEECNLGNLIADALREETGAQITYMNGGGIRSDIEAGVITMGHILTVQPFNNVTSTFDLTGSDVLAMLENSVSRIQLNEQGQVQRGGASGRFLQISGARFSIDPTQEVGSRIVSVEVLNDMGEFEPLDPEAVYSIAGNNYVRTGGDGYSVLEENAINPYDGGRVDFNVTLDYLVANSPVSPATEGRITYVNAEVEPLEG